MLVLLALAVVAVVLTVSRLVEPAGVRWRQVEAFTPYGFPAWTPVLLVALVWLVRSHGVRRLVPALALLVAAGGLGAHVSWFLPQVSGAQPPPSAQADPLRVMTANLQLGGDAVGLVESAAEEEVDLLVVQEITPQALESMESAGVATMLPYRAGEPARGTRGTMVFSRLELGTVEPLDTSMDSFSVPVTVDAEDLLLAAVHVSPPLSAAWAAEHRVLGDWVRSARPDLVVGDFNATSDHRPMRSLAAAGYRSTTELANEGWRPTWPTSARVPLLPWSLVQIDHVLCGPDMAALTTRTVGVDGSDHRAVVAEVAAK